MGVTIALAGTPNCGKTTLFNALTGSNQFVGNWPGVTVEKKEGKLKANKDVTLTDLPGIYSLSPYTLEEVVARNYLINEKPDAVINIIDGSNLERNLYLTTQVLETGIPTIIAINMMDVVEKNGDKIDFKKLGKEIGCEVVPISAMNGTGIDELANKAISLAEKGEPFVAKHHFTGAVEHTLAHIEEAALHDLPENEQRWYAVKIFENDEKALEGVKIDASQMAHIKEDIKKCEKELDDDAEGIIVTERYDVIAGWVKDSFVKNKSNEMTTSDKIDRIVTNRWLALPIFIVVMAAVYFISMQTVGAICTDFVNDTVFGEWIIPAASGFLESVGAAPWLHGLIVDGIISGVGAVLGFVPQMFVLFICLAFLESVGYMARIAFILDRFFRRFGLSGKSFIPMLIASGCGVPAIMGTRTIESDRDRRMTIMTTTFIPCSAKMPIIGLIAGAIFGGSALVSVSCYFVGVIAIIVSGIILKKTKLFAGDPAPFVMELPAYHWPRVTDVLRSAWERCWAFIKKAGTVILLSTIIIWFLQAFGMENGAFGMVENVENSILAFLGNGFAWIFIPLGWGTWKPAVATITGLIAKENVVGTFGILYGFAEIAENGEEIWPVVAADYTMASAYSFLTFNLLCAPCFAAIGAIKAEMGSAKWTLAAIGYQCGFAYAVSLMIYQFGSIGTPQFNVIGVIAAAIVLAGMLYLLFRKDKNREAYLAAEQDIAH